MQENPIKIIAENKKLLEQENFKRAVRKFIERIFDEKKIPEERFKYFLLAAKNFIKFGILEKDKFLSDLRTINELKDKGKFIDAIVNALNPILEAQKTNPKLVEEVQAEFFLEQGNYIKLNELLSYGYNHDMDSIHIHLAPSKELLRGIGKKNYLDLVTSGLKELAKIVQANENVKNVTTTSSVVADNPRYMDKLGFIIKKDTDEDNVEEAEMPRGRLLEYLDK